MTILQAIILGAVQGLTEFLPVSSSGHLVLAPWLANWTYLNTHPDVNKAFDVALHLGTFIALVIYFWPDFWRLVRGAGRSLRTRRFEDLEGRLAWLLLLSALPGGVFGFLGESLVVEHLDAPWVIAVTLTVFGTLMLFVDRIGRKDRPLESVTTADALFIGFAQAIALAPGTSRSGVTLTAGILRNLTREAAVRFSFLMSIPIIGGAVAYQMLGLAADGLPAGVDAGPLVTGVLTSFVTGYAAIAFLLRWLRTRTLTPFVVYRYGVSLLIAVLVVTGVRPAS